jgi:hypothetical protein
LSSFAPRSPKLSLPLMLPDIFKYFWFIACVLHDPPPADTLRFDYNNIWCLS